MSIAIAPRLAMVVALVAVCARPLDVAGHPGHGTMALVGTLVDVEVSAIVLEARGPGAIELSRFRVRVGPDTKLRVGKETLATLSGRIGASVVATVDYEEGPDGQTVYVATKVQVNLPKKKRR